MFHNSLFSCPILLIQLSRSTKSGWLHLFSHLIPASCSDFGHAPRLSLRNPLPTDLAIGCKGFDPYILADFLFA